MNRTIFLRELRVGLLQELVIVGTLLSLFAAGVWLAAAVYDQPIREMVAELLLFPVVLAGLLAFSSGARTFTAESRRRQELFFFILPISRRALWLSLIGGRLAAAFPVPALLVLANGLLRDGLPGLRHLGPGGMAVFLVLFASGACLSLFFRRDTVAYLAGALITFPVVAQTLAFTTSGFSPGSLRERLSALSVGLLAAAFLGLSWFFFQRGEVQARTRQLANLTLVGGTLTSFLLLLGDVTLSPFLDRFAGPWTQATALPNPLPVWEISTARQASPSGRYLAVVETLRERPGISRVTVIETATGRRVGEHRWRDLAWVSWDARKQVLGILCRDDGGPFFWRMGEKPRTLWVLLTPEGREIARRLFWHWNTAMAFRSGPDLLVEENGGNIRLISLLEPEHAPVLIEMVQPGTWSITPTRQGILVQAEKTWHVADGAARELRADEREAWLQSMASRETELRRKARLLASGSSAEDPLLEWRAFMVQDDIVLYLPAGGAGGRAALYDGTLDREIPLPGCNRGRSAAPGLISTLSGPAFLASFDCRIDTASGPKTIRSRHYFYLPGSGSAKPLPGLDPVLENRFIRLAWLDERTAIWRPEKGETWKILQNGHARTLWPTQSSELLQ